MPAVTEARVARLAAKLSPDDTWDDAREVVDLATGWELDCTQLDLLTDWAIEARDAAFKAKEGV